MEIFNLQTDDKFKISATLFQPGISNGKLLLINSATGVKQQIYYAFARYFAENGFTVLTYDYRGIGLSKPQKIRGFEASMRDWGTLDFKAMNDFIQKKFPEEIKFCLGHSVGALILGMSGNARIFEKFIFVGTQDANIGNLIFSVAITAFFGFGIAVPVTSKLLGYFPAHWFGLGESLPKNAALDWRTLILNKKSTRRLYEKIKNDNSKELTQQVFVIHAEDDHWVTKKGMENLLNKGYPNLKPTFREIRTVESPKNEIGHINFFRSFNKNLWKIVENELK